MRQINVKPARQLTRIEIENAAAKVGIQRREIWLVKSADVLKLIAQRACEVDNA